MNYAQSSAALIVTRARLAEVLSVSTATVDRLRKVSGFPQARKIGKRLLAWEPADVEAWLRLQPREAMQ